MSTALKDRYNKNFIETLAAALRKVTPPVDTSNLVDDVFTTAFNDYELKDRMYHITKVLHGILSSDFSIACNQIVQLTHILQDMGVGENFEYMFLPDYVSTYGLDQFEQSMETLAAITSFTSAEFAVRPFIHKYPTAAIDKMIEWTKHKNAKIRRLASEGTRPRLPWAMALPEFKRDPSPALPILKALKNDTDEVVRRSVANHLNDICKDNPEIAIQLALDWFGKTNETNDLIKHGTRTLLKQGHPTILNLFGLDAQNLDIEQFKVHTPQLCLGERLSFSFNVLMTSNKPKLTRIEFIIYLLKQNGTHSKKIFKISERMINNAVLSIEKKHHIKPITTRVYHTGEHYVSIVLNGKEFSKLPFYLTV